MNRRTLYTLFVAALLGATVWLLSPWVAGHNEPWDGDGTYYFGALIVTGLIAGIASPKPIWAHYVGSFIGQLSFGLLFLDSGPLVVVGAAFLLLCCLPVVVAAFVSSKLKALLSVHGTVN